MVVLESYLRDYRQTNTHYQDTRTRTRTHTNTNTETHTVSENPNYTLWQVNNK